MNRFPLLCLKEKEGILRADFDQLKAAHLIGRKNADLALAGKARFRTVWCAPVPLADAVASIHYHYRLKVV